MWDVNKSLIEQPKLENIEIKNLVTQFEKIWDRFDKQIT